MLSVSAGIISSVASRTTNCLGGRGRRVINFRARGPLGHDLVPFNNVHVDRRTYRRTNCGISPRISVVFHSCEGARGRNMFSTCAPRVHTTEAANIVANLPSTCNHKHVVNSCHHITLCNISCLVRSGLGRFTGVNSNAVARRVVHLERRFDRRCHTLGRLGRLKGVCKFSVSGPTAGTGRTFR